LRINCPGVTSPELFVDELSSEDSLLTKVSQHLN